MSLPWNRTTFILDQPYLSIYLFLKRPICASETGARHQLLPFAPRTTNASGLNKEGNLASSGTLQWRHFLKVIALMLVNRSQPLPRKPCFGTLSSFEGSEKQKLSSGTVNAVPGGGVTTPCSVEHSQFRKSNSLIKVWQTWCHIICFCWVVTQPRDSTTYWKVRNVYAQGQQITKHLLQDVSKVCLASKFTDRSDWPAA